jgi:hypothetical protein
MKNTFVIVILVVVATACSKQRADWRSRAENAERAHRSIKHITDIIVHDIFSPPVASRIYAYVSIAGYEVARHQDEKFVSFSGQLNGLEAFPKPEAGQEYCYALASCQAMLKVGRALVFSEDKLDEFYGKIMQEFKDSGMPDDVYERSVAYGTAVADHVMAWSSKDNYKQSRSFPKYSILDEPATW